MRTFRNLLWLVVGLLLGGMSCLAFAEGSVGPPAIQKAPLRYYLNSYNANGPFYPSAAAGCQAVQGHASPTLAENNVNSVGEILSGVCRSNGINVAGVHATCPTGFNSSVPPGCASNTAQCPTGSTLTAGQCICNSGLKPFNGQCVAPKCETKDTDATEDSMSDIYSSGSPNLPSSACVGGCMAYLFTIPAKVANCRIVGGVRQCKYKFAYMRSGGGNGDACTAGQGGVDSPTASQPQPAESCGAGQGMIKMDGVTRCVNTSTGQPVNTSPPTTNTQTNNQTTTQNPNGTTTVTRTTTNTSTGGTTTVTEVYGPGVTPGSGIPPISTTTGTTGGGAGGGTGGSTGGEEDGDGKTDCDKHPDSLACEDMGTPTQTDNLAQPTLYERKYPDGIQGVWTARRSELMGSPLGALLTKFTTVPQLGNSACPSFELPAGNVLGMSMGGSITPPCWIWPAIKAVLIISACFLARSLIFGG